MIEPIRSVRIKTSWFLSCIQDKISN